MDQFAISSCIFFGSIFFRSLILITFLSLNSGLSAQFNTSNWYFGDEGSNAGMIFFTENGDPIPQNTRVSLDMSENNAMVLSNSIVKLHSNGEKILNELSLVMPNGSDLKGSANSMYGSTFVAHPNFCDHYYLFYTQSSDDPPPRKIYYSVIDPNIIIEEQFFDTKGDVILSTKDTDITAPNVDVAESIYVVQKNLPKLGAWLFMSGRNTNSIYIYEISSSGVSLHKTYSLAELNLNGNGNSLMNVKFDSWDVDESNSRLVLAPTDGISSSNKIGSFNFNRETGEIDVTSLILFDIQTTFTYGTAFSLDGTKVYYSDHITKSLKQFDYTTDLSTTIGTSKHNGKSGGLKLAPNNKIYWASIFDHDNNHPINSLSVISQPNISGIGCTLLMDDYNIGALDPSLKIGVLPTILTTYIRPSLFLQNNASCGDDNGVAQVSADPELSPLDYNWDNGETMQTASALSKGLQRITITTLDNCIYQDSILIEEISDFDLSDIDVSSFPPSDCVLSNGSISIYSSNILKDSLYTITYSDTDGNMTTSVVQANADQNLFIDDLVAGTYIDLEISSTYKVCSYKHKDTIELFGSSNKPSLGNDTILCENEVYLLDPTGQFQSYEWSDGSTQRNLEIVDSGAYILKVKDENGCSNADTITIIFAENPTISKSIDITIEFGDSIQLNPTISSASDLEFNWSPPEDLSCIDCPNPIASPPVSKEYSIITVDTNLCSDSSSVKVNVEKYSGAYLPNIFTPDQNDANSRFGVEGISNDIASIKSFQIYDRWGQKFFTRKDFLPGMIVNSWDGTFAGKQASEGIYIYIVELELVNGSTRKQVGDLVLIR